MALSICVLLPPVSQKCVRTPPFGDDTKEISIYVKFSTKPNRPPLHVRTAAPQEASSSKHSAGRAKILIDDSNMSNTTNRMGTAPSAPETPFKASGGIIVGCNYVHRPASAVSTVALVSSRCLETVRTRPPRFAASRSATGRSSTRPAERGDRASTLRPIDAPSPPHAPSWATR